jgi:Zn-dependent protease/CBS domain-containing protein
MKWSWRVGKLAGISIYLHATFAILPLWAGHNYFQVRHNWGDAFAGAGLGLLLFVIIVLHELGHALVARRFGIGTRDITLLPIGGVARLERMPRDPKQELLIALAGPAVNVCLAVLLFAIIGGGYQFARLLDLDPLHGNFLLTLMWVNLFLAFFNMVPAFPMDGGRVLRAMLAIWLKYERATTIAARIGQSLAFLFGVAGVMTVHPLWVLIAVFVYMGAAQEAGFVQLQSALEGIKVGDVMLKEVRALTPRQKISEAVMQVLDGWQYVFPVLDDQRVVGVVSRTRLLHALKEMQPGAVVAELMPRRLRTVTVAESVENALTVLRSSKQSGLPVLADDGKLAGIITIESVREYLLVNSALAGDAEARGWPQEEAVQRA